MNWISVKEGMPKIARDVIVYSETFGVGTGFHAPWTFKSGGEGSGLYLTVDGGDNWKKLSDEDGLPKGNLGRIGIAIAPSDPNRIYALVESDAV